MNYRLYWFILFLLFLILAGISFMPKVVLTADTSSVTMTFLTGEEGNVFSDASPQVKIGIKNSKPGLLTGTGTFTVTDQDGNQTTTWTEQFHTESTATLQHDIPVSRYGLYHLIGTLTFSNGTKLQRDMSFAYVPKQKELSEEQKLASPYGININSLGTRFFDAFKKAGIYWYRDTAFNLDQMAESRGADPRYAGWPDYSAIVQDYEKHGLIVMPNLLAIHPAEIKDSKVARLGPTDEWVSKIRDIVTAFPTIKYWELDNEYDLHRAWTEHSIAWQNYLLYHKKFGELLSTLGDGKLIAVENGRQDIWSKMVDSFIKTGDFDNIGVINSHHYPGPDPPETSFYNYNNGGRSDFVPGTIFDMLRAMKKSAQIDGKNRQSWLTEFGWDTRTGPQVSMEEQAAYLQRGFLLALASGTDKAFWFDAFDIDSDEYIFDGCGLYTCDQQPKLSLAAMAGLTSLLRQPVYVGTINAGPDTAGYVFESEGQLVAGLWTITGTGAKVTFHAKQLKDYLGNDMAGLSADLKITPVYAIGLDKSDLFYRQTTYDLATPYRTDASVGTQVESVLVIRNNRAETITATVKLSLPSDWIATTSEVTASVAPGEQREIHFPCTINPDESDGIHKIALTCMEGTETIKVIPANVIVHRPLELRVASISGEPGKTSVPVTVTNRSDVPQSGQLVVKAPKGWAVPAPIPVKEIQPGKREVIPVELTWNTDWNGGEPAWITFQPKKGVPEKTLLIPSHYHLNKAKGIILDGNLTDWPKEDEFPEWLLGSTSDKPNAKLWLAWAPEGLYGAMEVHDSKGRDSYAKKFWYGDALELFFPSTSDTPSPNPSENDQHFWLVPDFKNNRVYAGQWIAKNLLNTTHYDLPGIKSAARRTDDGYVMEFLLPASVLDHYAPATGDILKLNLNLDVCGNGSDREVYWPRSKYSREGSHTSDWGLVKLN